MLLLCSLLLLAQADGPSIDKLPGDPPSAVSKSDGTKSDGTQSGAVDTATKSAAEKAESPAPAPANAAEKPAEASSEKPAGAKETSWVSQMLHSGALGYMIDGGIFMWPILALGILALGVIIERFRALMMLNTRAEALRTQVRELLEADRVEEALQICDREQGPVPAILGAGLRKYLVARRLGYDPAKIEEQVVKGMDDYSIHIVAAMEKHLPILATVASAAPMLGFLGTVSGMVTSFDEINRRIGEANIVELAAGGIMVSLLTTVLGLIVGIPAFVAFNYFTSAINQFVLDVEESAAELMEAVTFQLAVAGRDGNSITTESKAGSSV